MWFKLSTLKLFSNRITFGKDNSRLIRRPIMFYHINNIKVDTSCFVTFITILDRKRSFTLFPCDLIDMIYVFMIGKTNIRVSERDFITFTSSYLFSSWEKYKFLRNFTHSIYIWCCLTNATWNGLHIVVDHRLNLNCLF